MSSAEKSDHPAAHRGVVVYSPFDEGWHRGFVISDVVMGESGAVGYHLRRTSDLSPHPGLVAAADIRVEDVRRSSAEHVPGEPLAAEV